MNVTPSPFPRIMSIPEAMAYQRHIYGRLVFGRDALYALARSGRVKVVRVGQHKILFPQTTIDRLLTGEISYEEVL